MNRACLKLLRRGAMSRALLAMIAASMGCAPSPTAMIGREGTTEPLCWWRNARWDDRGELLVRGTRVPLAHARARWAGDDWKGARTTAVLRRSGSSVVLQGEWLGPGAALLADVDVASRAVFRAFEPRRIGATGLLLKGGHVLVKDALVGRALVVPSDEAQRPFRSEVPPAAELSCEGLYLSATMPRTGDAARALLAQAGFSADAPEQWVPPNASVPASTTPGGPTVGFFVAEQAPLRGFVVEQREGEARLVVPTPEGIVWVGWVAAETLRAPPAAIPEQKGEPQQASGTRVWRTCERDLPLRVELNGRLIQVGTLLARTPFSAEVRAGDYREVELNLDWLELSARLSVLVPADAFDCPRLSSAAAW